MTDFVDSKSHFDDVFIRDKNERLIEAAEEGKVFEFMFWFTGNHSIFVRLGHLEIVKLLIEKNANVNTRDFKQNNWTPLHYAAYKGDKLDNFCDRMKIIWFLILFV